MMIDIPNLLAAATTQPWQDAVTSAYGHSQIVLATSSFAMYAMTFTAVSSLLRIKDKLYDEPAYHKRVARLQSIDPSLKEYRPYEQLHSVFTFARWAALGSGTFNLALIFASNWWLAIIAYIVFAVVVISVGYFAHLFHVNLAEITKIDQQKKDDERKARAVAAAQEVKPFMKWNSVQ